MRQVGATVLVVLAVVLASSVRATEGNEAVEIRRVIADQIAAFQSDDADRAFGHASPGIRQRFGSAAIFMHLVREAYRPLYRVRSYQFEPIETAGDQPMQPVRVVGADGQVSLALYQMERQDDGAWKIAGCVLVRLAESVT